MKSMKISIFLLSVLLSSCAVQTYNYQVNHIKKTYDISDNSLAYALPQTGVIVTAHVIKKESKPGPFRKYAKEYLGLNEVISVQKTSWNITDLSFETFSRTDPEEYFIIQGKNHAPVPNTVLGMAEKGLILPVQTLQTSPYEIKPQTRDENVTLEYAWVAHKRNIAERNDTINKKVYRDTGYIHIPILRKQFEKKTEKDKAQEAAHMIYKIRKRKFKFTAGMYNFIPGDKALKTAIEELDALEDEYMSLFAGKTVEFHYTYKFEVIPDKNTTKKILFRFSEDNGIPDGNNLEGRPVMIQFDRLNTTLALEQFMNKQAGNENINKLIYRIPEAVKTSVIDGQQILFEKEIPVFQYGQFVTIPITFPLK